MKPKILIVEPDRYPSAAVEILKGVGEPILRNENADIREALGTADALMLRLKYKWTEELLNYAPNLKVIATATTGLDHIDLAETKKRGIAVLSLKGETEFLKTVTATAEHTWGLLLALLRHIPEAHQSVSRGEWNRNLFFARELQERTLGIVGLGRIGQMVARYGLAFRMQVKAYDPHQTEWVEGVERVENLSELLKQSDVISVHIPLTKENEGFIGAREIREMKEGAILLNTSRGGILDERALLESLHNGRLSGAALDVIQNEYVADDPLRQELIQYSATHSNLLITPHIGGASHDALARVEVFMARKLALFLENLEQV
jgi:D-3-phosphoglycerate dehydrogenase